MTRWLAALLAVAFSTPALAQEDEPKPEWTGVWEGTIGTYPIVACLDTQYDSSGQGSYYYLKHLIPIDLASEVPPGEWSEGGFARTGPADPKPLWQLGPVERDTIWGTWTGGDKSLPIALGRVAEGGEDAWSPCASAKFLQPRVVAPEFVRSARMIDGLAYAELQFIAPKHFPKVAIGAFTFEPSQPGDEAILAWVAEKLPKGTTEDEYIQCMAGALGVHGVDGDYDMTIAPAFANSELLSLTRSQGDYCGGAHPNYWQEYATFDRRTGAKLDSADWFNERGMALDEYQNKLMQQPLRELIVARWPVYEGEPDECSGYALDQQWWNYQIRREGILFQPDFPHVITACEEEILVQWGELDPFLSEVGKTLRDRAQR
jgi:hypothetical protein